MAKVKSALTKSIEMITLESLWLQEDFQDTKCS